MTPEKLLQKLPAMMKSGAAKGRGGLMLLRFDRAGALRDQLGFTGLSMLFSRLEARISGSLDHKHESVRFDWASMLVLIPEVPGEAFEDAVVALFYALTDEVYEVGSDDLALTVSLSHARFDHRFTQVDEILLPLFRQADAIESQGGNAMAEVRPGISVSQALASSDHMLGLLMEALRTDSLRVVFQPLLATSGEDAIASYQMLPRLAAGDGRLITAAEFLPLARDAALLPVIDRWMTVRAMQLLRGSLKGRDVRLFINQSEALLADADRREWLARQLAADPGLASYMVLELPLEDAMSHLRGAKHLFELSRQYGVGICLSHVDEHSRWELLTGDLEPHYVRMAAGFVSRLTKEPSLQARFMKLSEAVRQQGTRIIMPMIEDSQTAASMWRSGADFMQGNMIQAPEDSIAV